MNLKRVLAVTKKEILHLRRDIRLTIMIFIQPIMLLIIFGYAISLDVKNISTAWLDQEKSYQSFQFKKEVEASGYFKINYICSNYKQIKELFNKNKVKIGIVIPTNFTKKLLSNKISPVQILADGSENNICSIALGYLEGIKTNYNSKLLTQTRFSSRGLPPRADPPLAEDLGYGEGRQLSAAGEPATGGLGYGEERQLGEKTYSVSMAGAESRVRIWYNPELKSSYFIVPGIIALVVMILTSLLSAFSISREKETGTLEKLSLSPLSAGELIIGKIIPYMFLAFIDVCLVVLAGFLIFSVPVKGSLILLLFLSLIFIIVPVAFGLLFSTIAETQQTAMMMVAFTTILPTVMLSGFVFPINAMPKWLQAVTVIIPAKYFLIILRGIFLKGIGLEKLSEPTGALIILTCLIVFISTLRLKRILHGFED